MIEFNQFEQDQWGKNTRCEYPRCKAHADYGNMDCMTDCGEEFGVLLCHIHANVVLNYNDDKDDWEWDKLTREEKRRVSQIVYRLRNHST